MLEDADRVFRVVSVREHREVCYGLLPVGWCSFHVWHIIPAQRPKRLPDEGRVISTVDKRVLLYRVDVAIVDITAVLQDVLLGVSVVGVLSVDEVCLSYTDDVAVIFPEGNPLHSQVLETKAQGDVEGLFQGRVLLDHSFGPELVVALNVLVLYSGVPSPKEFELTFQCQDGHGDVILELRLEGHGVGFPVVPVGNATQIHQVAEVDDNVPFVVGHETLNCPERLLILPWYVHVW